MIGLLFQCSSKNKIMSERITVIGVAYNAKDGAIIKTSDGTFYYLDDLITWDSQYLSQTVEVSGFHHVTTIDEKILQNEKGEHRAGISGTRHSLSKISYTLKSVSQ